MTNMIRCLFMIIVEEAVYQEIMPKLDFSLESQASLAQMCTTTVHNEFYHTSMHCGATGLNREETGHLNQ